MNETEKVFELTVCNLKCEENAAKDAVFDCTNEKSLDIIVGKTGNNFTISRIVGILISVEVNKRIGTHNNIKARLKIVQQTSATDMSAKLNVSLLKNAFHRREVRLNAIVNDESHAIAEKYYIFGVKPIYNKDGATYYVDLNIYSWDKLMDITKYSKSYANKKLGGDIMKEFMNGYQNAPECQTSGMRMLVHKSDGENEKPSELVFPFLEQYDETEYNFLLRNANKCGEFFYFENGTLNLGLTRIFDEANGANGQQEVVTEIDESSYASIESLSDENNDVETIEAFYQDAADVRLSENKLYEPMESNGTLGTTELPKKDTSDDWDCVFAPIWSRMLASFFQYDNITSLGLEIAETELSTYSYKKLQSDSFNEKVVEPYIEGLSNNNSNKVYCKYAPDDKLFKLMDKAKLNVSDNQYRITFDDGQLNLKLGDIVSCSGIGNDGRFVVVDVHSVFEKEDVVADAKIVNRMEVTVIPVYKDSPIPLPVDMKLKSSVGLQDSLNSDRVPTSNTTSNFAIRTATVAESADPYRQNQVRVKYDGDSDESSEWIRVLTPFASADKGISCKLNVGDKVVVLQNLPVSDTTKSFVIGSFYDGDNAPPCGQRKFSSLIRSNNGQYIGFEESKSMAGILTSFFPGLSMVKNLCPPLYLAFPSMQTEDEDKLMALGGIEISDNYGLFTIAASSSARTITISSPFGTVGIDAAMGITISAPNGNVKIVGKNVDIVAGNNLTLKSGANIDSGLAAIRHKSNVLNCLKAEGQTLVDALTGLFDIPALRFVVELLFKPVAGTLKVHSGRYLMLEAGEGEASLPDGMFHKIISKVNKDLLNDKGEAVNIEAIVNSIGTWTTKFKAYQKSCIDKYKGASDHRASLLSDIVKDFNQTDGNKDVTNDYANQIIDEWISSANANIDANQVAQKIVHKNALVPGSGNYNEIVKAVKQIIEMHQEIWKDDFGKGDIDNENLFNIAKGIRKDVNDDEKSFKITNEDSIKSTIFVADNDKKKKFREGILEIIKPLYSYDEENELENDVKWSKVIESIKPKKEDYIKTGVINAGLDALNNLLPIESFDTFCWSKEAKGEILMSQNEDSTLSFNGQTISERTTLTRDGTVKNAMRNATL